MEQLEVDIEDLKNAYSKLIEALNDIQDVDELDNKLYEDLDAIAQELDDLRREKENKLEEMQEEEDAEGNMQQWDKEYRTLENEYWKSQF